MGESEESLSHESSDIYEAISPEYGTSSESRTMKYAIRKTVNRI